MSHRLMWVRQRYAGRLQGLLVALSAAGLALPLLVASGGASTPVDDVVAAARAEVGDAYLWGGNGPDAWDCSGFTSYVWGAVGGVTGMPRVSGAQQRWAVPIPREQLLPGDLVFLGDPVTHVALFIGDGKVVDASSARAGVVERPLWTATVTRFGRVPRAGMPVVAPWTPPPTTATPTLAPSATPTAPPAVAPAAPAAAPVVGPVAGPAPAAPVRPAVSRAPAVRPSAAPRVPAAPAGPGPARPGSAAGVPAARPAAPARPGARPAAPPARPTAATARPAAPAAVRPLPGLPAVQTRPSSPVALAALARVRSQTGATRWTDVGIVREAWRHAGGGALPADRDALVARGQQVARPDVRVGDLVVYGVPARQVYVYAGSGYMVGHSPTHGRVAVRRVHTGDVRFVRLPA